MMKIQSPTLLRAVILGAAVYALSPNALSLEIVKNGKPNASIVVANDASEQVKNAAQTLQEYIEKSSGAKLPIKSTFDGTDNAISIGNPSEVNTSELDEDGFILQGIGKKYFIAGGSDWGTEFGVYDFLERYLGVRWLMPTDVGIDIPKHSTIDIPEEKITENPVFLSRELSPLRNLNSSNVNSRWGRFNRARGRVKFHHNLRNLFPPSKFAETHPEFYPVINGKRLIPDKDGVASVRWQPNLSAPGIVDAAVAEIEKYFAEHPEATSYSLGMNDSNNWDESPASKARRNGKQNYLGYEDVSDDYFKWANAVVEKVLLKYPDKWFGTLAYNGVAEPPTRVKVHPRIVPFITYDRMRWEDPKLRKKGQEMTRKWAKESPTLAWYDYAYGYGYLVPRVYFHRMQKYLSWGAENQVQFSYAELYPNWGEGPKPWVFEKLLWNPNQDVDELLNDWYVHFAGEKAAPKLASFYSIWEKFWTEDIYKSSWNTDRGQYLPYIKEPSYLADIPPAYLTQAAADFNAALELADTPERKARMAKLKEMWDFYQASIIAYRGTDEAPIQTEKQALSFLDNMENVLEKSQERRDILSALQKDSLYGPTMERILGRPAIAGINWGTASMWRALPWMEKSSNVKKRLEELTKSTFSQARKQASLMLQVASGKFSPKTTNASFEEGTKEWTLWDKHSESSSYRKGIWKTSSEQSHTGKSSLSIQGLERGGPYQSVPVTSGEYFAEAYFFIPKMPKGEINLGVTMISSEGKSVGKVIGVPGKDSSFEPNTWNRIIVPFTIDEKEVASVRALFMLEEFAEEDIIYIDDMGIYKIDD